MNMYYATKNATFNAINAIKFFAIPRGQGSDMKIVAGTTGVPEEPTGQE